MSLFAQELIQKSDVSDILDQTLHGKRVKLNDCIRLIKSDNPYALGMIGNILRDKLYGKVATFVNNIILNYTNVCITYCKFCAFYRAPGDNEGYTLSVEDVVKRVVTARDHFGITQVLMQGGHNPELNIEYYEGAFKTVKERCPDVAIHGLSASEIDTISKVGKSSTKEVLSRLKAAGLDSLPGAGAEILDDDVKSRISPLKIKSSEWLNIMKEAHDMGIKSSATMMYGAGEDDEQRARHLIKIAELQEKTRGFMAFIPWSFEPNKTKMQSDGLIKYSSGGLELLKMIAISRIVFSGLIDHLQSSWLTNGVGMAQLALTYGADDFGGTLIGEEVVSATGARSTELTSDKIITAIKQIGFMAHERNNFYETIKIH
ncbi:MAG: dehypoxanthine futalosine cyclase [Thaumarchaeota archaeon]|nr:MAG: dehypoxanthine futalosine cyclase [Nitrososphaerota archaeon]TLX85509.1 MAG: dehypoxanthine futalosine cyclase [Nitrososphaerota archaeon]TLX90241.1 MAG: dehypoxanthine futalosine cyclase [Nitrososphaerota archaeon]